MSTKNNNENVKVTNVRWDIALDDFTSQGETIQQLIDSLRIGKNIHAYLISGESGVGKRTLADLMTQTLLCQHDHRPCGQCEDCIQVKTANHPDVLTLIPGEPVDPQVKKGMVNIPVADVRFAINRAGEHTFRGGRRIIRIFQAERMTPAAANALLKTLEEPPKDVVFILTTDKMAALLSTIISRCRPIKLHPWSNEYVQQVLRSHDAPALRIDESVRAAGGSIGKAWQMCNDEAYWSRRDKVFQRFFCNEKRSDVIRISTELRDQQKNSKTYASQVLNDVEDMIHTLLLVRLGSIDSGVIKDFPTGWQTMAKQAGIQTFTDLLDCTQKTRRQLEANVTWQAAAEQLLLRMMEEKNKW